MTDKPRPDHEHHDVPHPAPAPHPADLTRSLTFHLTQGQRDEILGALKRFHRDRVRALHMALDLDDPCNTKAHARGDDERAQRAGGSPDAQ